MPTFIQLLKQECGLIWRDKAVVLTVVGGIVFYAALYPQPYLHDVPRDLSVVAVDFDKSRTSRRLVRWADASPDVRISRIAASVGEAREDLTAGLAAGILVIPANFERDLRLSGSPVVGIAGNANYFLVYGEVVEGLVGAATAVGAAVQVTRLLAEGQPYRYAAGNWMPVRLTEQPLFNTNMGYLQYVVPAVFVLILHQTMLLASGLIGASDNRLAASVGKKGADPGLRLAARFSAMLLLYLVLSLLYLETSFRLYDVTRLASPASLWMMTFAFVAATASLGVLFGSLLPRRELAAPFVMASSLPLVFSAGFVWPIESIPAPLVSVSQWIPSTSSIQGFLKLNQMGADFDDVAHNWWWLVFLAAFYLVAAYAILRRRHLLTPRTREDGL